MIFKLGAFIGLSITLVSPFLAWSMMIDLELNKSMMLFGTIVWFSCLGFFDRADRDPTPDLARCKASGRP